MISRWPQSQIHALFDLHLREQRPQFFLTDLVPNICVFVVLLILKLIIVLLSHAINREITVLPSYKS